MECTSNELFSMGFMKKLSMFMLANLCFTPPPLPSKKKKNPTQKQTNKQQQQQQHTQTCFSYISPIHFFFIIVCMFSSWLVDHLGNNKLLPWEVRQPQVQDCADGMLRFSFQITAIPCVEIALGWPKEGPSSVRVCCEGMGVFLSPKTISSVLRAVNQLQDKQAELESAAVEQVLDKSEGAPNPVAHTQVHNKPKYAIFS